MSFEQQIQQWVALDNQLKQLNDKAKELRDKKTALSGLFMVAEGGIEPPTSGL